MCAEADAREIDEQLNSYEELGGFSHDESNEYGGAYVRYTTYSVPNNATDADLAEWVHNAFPATRCQHEYDCCGHYYAGKALWWRLTGLREIVIRQSWLQNV